MINYLLTALALMLIIEGIIPFLSPQTFRDIYAKMMEGDNASIRGSGFVMMVMGLILLYVVH